jgi:hypothetical protein
LHKAEEIIRRLRPEPPPPATWIWDYEWSLSIAEPTTDATYIANNINSYVSKKFHDVPFTEFVRAAYGCSSDIITNLLKGVSITRNELSCLLQECNTLRSGFELVEKVSLQGLTSTARC